MMTFGKSLFGVAIISIALLMLFTCSKPPRPIPKQGDTVTWLINDFLIIGTQLGERRKHIPRSTDSRYYEPEFEKYIGQFPVDFIPEPRPQLSMQAFFPLKNL